MLNYALAARHIVSNVVGYSVYGDYLQPNPPGRIIDAVARGDVGVAVAWGPLAGYFAAKQPVALVNASFARKWFGNESPSGTDNRA